MGLFLTAISESLAVLSNVVWISNVSPGYFTKVLLIVNRNINHKNLMAVNQQFSDIVILRENKKPLLKLLLLVSVYSYLALPGFSKGMFFCFFAGRDVFVLAPTGMGKVCIGSLLLLLSFKRLDCIQSLCFQLPAIWAKAGVTLVISPLCGKHKGTCLVLNVELITVRCQL